MNFISCLSTILLISIYLTQLKPKLSSDFMKFEARISTTLSMFICPKKYSPIFNTSNASPSELVVFKPDLVNPEIYASQNFTAYFYVNGVKTTYQFVIITTNNYQNVGYTAQLNNLLSDCRCCGCIGISGNDNTHMVCKSSDICQHSLNKNMSS